MTHQKSKTTTGVRQPEKRKKLTLSKETLKDLDAPDQRAVKGGLSLKPQGGRRGGAFQGPQTGQC